ncbi:MAG TPA: ABC transporter permease [Thermoanaerobaculia bacterium]|nr:ABC transporter permease [Thermoanaerobaculia bacterium]
MGVVRDLIYSLRALRRSPWFSITAVASLAIGIGASTAIFTLVNSLLLRPLPGVAEPERLVNVFRNEVGEKRQLGGFPLAAYRDYRDFNDVFFGLAVFTDRALSLTRNGESELVAAQVVSGNYFAVLGARPAKGRFFLPEEDRTRGTHRVAVVSHALWRRRFGGDPSLVGKELILNGIPFTVIGIAAEGFGGTFFGFVSDVFLPTAMADLVLQRTDLENRHTVWLEAIGRLRPGVSPARAQAGMNTIARRLALEHPEDRNFEIALTPMTGYDRDIQSGVVGLLAVLLAVAGFVLLIACVNVAGMLLARAAVRSKEIAIRLALGMARARLIRQLLTESVFLALLGAGGGFLLASWGLALLRQFEPPLGIRLVFDFTPDLRVLGFTLAISVVCGLAFGMVPARQAASRDLVPELKEGAGQGRSGAARLRSAFVVGQVAVSLLLLITAGLFLRALHHAASAYPGFDPNQVETVTLDPAVLGYDNARSRELFMRLSERVAALPGVLAVCLADATPLGLGNLFGTSRTPVKVDGRQPPAGQDAFKVEYSRIGTRYFEVLRIQLLRGRDFSAADRERGHPVAVVNETMARHFWPGEDPIGKRFLQNNQVVEIVGLAKDSKYSRVNEDPRDFLYLPFPQAPGSRMTLFARVGGSPTALAPAVRREVRQLAGNLPILSLMTMLESIAVSRLPQRIAATVASLLGLTGLLLAAVGIYGVVSYSVAQRKREIGMRMALGAHQGDVLRLVVRQGLVLALAGVGIGTVGALALSRLLAGLLFGLSPSDPVTFFGIAILLVATALGASFFPARRASRTDPMEALRAG